MSQDRAGQAALVTSFLKNVSLCIDKFESNAGNTAIRKAATAARSSKVADDASVLDSLVSSGMNGSAIFLSEDTMLTFAENLYVSMCEEIGPSEADQALNDALARTEADPAVVEGSPRRWF